MGITLNELLRLPKVEIKIRLSVKCRKCIMLMWDLKCFYWKATKFFAPDAES